MISCVVFPPTSPFEKKSRGAMFRPPRRCQARIA